MGKGGRIACITIPMVLTIASFICLALIEVSGWSKGTLGSYYMAKINLTDLDVGKASTLDNTTTLTAALELAQKSNELDTIYEIHLWNYCYSEKTNGDITKCSKRQSGFVFDPVDVLHLNSTSSPTSTSSASNVIASEEANLKNNAEGLENELLGKSGAAAMKAYRKVAKIMFTLYAVSFWATLATIVVGILAIFSRIGSFLTWILSILSSLINLAAVLTSTILFAALVGALEGVLKPYSIHVSLGTNALRVTWLSVVFSWAATLFWLFSVCCCSGKSNPHHRNNKGGLWNAEPKGQGYGNYGGGYGGRSRGMRVEKTGGGYERVASPFLGHAENEHGDRVPLNDYPQPSGQSYEPFRRT